MKQCSKCKSKKDESSFSKRKSSADGLYGWCKECAKEYRKKDYEENADKHKARNRKWRENNSDYNKTRNKQWMEENPERRKEYKQNYRKENRVEINAYKRKKYHQDMQNPLFRLKEGLRNRLRKYVKRKGNTKRSLDLVGCTIDNLLIHLESKFEIGMTWNNYGDWHVDHIIPISSFDFTCETEVQRCFHYTNLQPLWAEDNIRKSNTIILDESKKTLP